MSAPKFNLLEIYRRTFGGFIASPFFDAKLSNYIPGSTEFEPDTETPELKFEDRSSYLGTPLFMPTKIDGYDLPNEPIIEVDEPNIIAKTTIDGKKGSFKEQFALDDGIITIRGVIVNEEEIDEFPEDAVRRISELRRKGIGLKVQNKLLTILGITQLAIENVRWIATPGSPGTQGYVINALSDEEFDMELKDVDL